MDSTPYCPHGTDVLYSAVVTARLWELLQKEKHSRQPFDRAAWERNIWRVYTSSASGVIALQDKVGLYVEDDSEWIEGHWNEICDILTQAPGEAQMRRIPYAIGYDMKAFELMYRMAKINDVICWAKDLKDRYSVL